jgi:pyruvyltransferase
MRKKLFWYKSTNFGDMLSPYLLAKMQNVSIDEIDYVGHNDLDPKWIITGSVLSCERIESAIIFGAGFVYSNNYFTANNTIVAGVRGRMTLDKIFSEKDKHGNKNVTVVTNVVIGEPSLLLPLYYTPVCEKKYRLGIIPHLFDYERAKELYSDQQDVLVISLGQPQGVSLSDFIESVIYQINQCEATISSSLHGLIVSVAYGIPTDWCEFFSDSLIGDRFKFYDFIDSIGNVQEGNGYMKPIDLISEKISVGEIMSMHRGLRNEKVSVNTILQSPFIIRL